MAFQFVIKNLENKETLAKILKFNFPSKTVTGSFFNFSQKFCHCKPNSILLILAAADLSELNLHCEENELGAIIVKSTLDKKEESEESEESSDQSFDLMCRETLSPANAKWVSNKYVRVDFCVSVSE